MCYFSVKLAQKIKWEMCFALFYVYFITQLICILNNTFQFWTDHLSAFTATCTVFLKLLCFVFA